MFRAFESYDEQSLVFLGLLISLHATPTISYDIKSGPKNLGAGNLGQSPNVQFAFGELRRL